MCTRCKRELPLDSFCRNSRSWDGRQSNCVECMAARHQERALRDPTYQRRRHLWARYRLTIEDYDRLLVSQGGGCAICGATPGDRVLHVDHDHSCCAGVTTCGKCLRALLCDDCNRGIGMFQENPDLLQAAAQYLRTVTGGSL